MANRVYDWTRWLYLGVSDVMPSDILQLIRLSRLFDAAFPLVSLFLGSTVVGQLNSPNLFMLVVVIVILNSVAMIWNDLEDRHIDADNGRDELQLSTPAKLFRLKVYVTVLVGISLLLAWLVSTTAVLFTAVFVCSIWVYNSLPFQASRRPIMSIIVLSGAGAFLPYLFGLSLGSSNIQMLIGGIFWWIGRVSLSVLKDYKDARGDARHHKKTFLLYFGARKVAWVSVLSLIAGYGGFIMLMYHLSSMVEGVPMLIGAVGFFAYMRRTLFDSQATHAQFDSTFRRLAQYQLLLDVGVVFWLT